MKILKKILLSVLALSVLLTGSVSAMASGDDQSTDTVVDELWGVPFLAYGASLSESELAEIHRIFGLEGLEEGRDFDAVYVDGNDLVYFLGQGNPSANMLSSVLIRRREPGTGVEVSILTPDYITRVTATQYATAMITAGVTDALVEVAAPSRVTGEAALTGIYKAFAERGVELDEDRMAVAQEQLQLTSGISYYHNDNEDFDPDILDQAVLEIQGELADHYQSTGELATQGEIEAIVAEVLDSNNLDDILTSDQIGRIQSFAGNFQLTDAINSQDFRNQLSNLADRVGNLIGDLDINIDRGMLATWWDNIVGFFQGIINWIADLFN